MKRNQSTKPVFFRLILLISSCAIPGLSAIVSAEDHSLPPKSIASIRSSGFQTNPEEIRQVLDKQVIAWNNGSIAGFMEGYWKNDSLRFVSKTGITFGWQAVTDRYIKSYPDKLAMGILKFTNLDIQMLDESYAFIAGSWQVSATGKISEGNFTLLFKKFSEGWKIICDHTS